MAMPRLNKLINFAVLFSFVMVYGGSVTVSEVYAANHDDEVLADYVAAVKGTAQYHNVNKAIADGYIEGDCEDERGVAFSNPNLIDDKINAAEPEFLLYDRQMVDGQEILKLRGVAYFIHANEEPPPIFGKRFLGPFGDIYFTHVWVWLEGPYSDLLVSRYHPMVGCE
jgi:hypothetical protein